MNHLYYEINMTGLGNTASALMKTAGKDRLTEIFTAGGLSSSEQTVPLPFNADDAYRVTLIDVSGHVLWDSYTADNLVNHIDREEIIAALEGREGSSRRESISTGMRRIYYALPVFGSYNNVIGVFRVSMPIPEFGSRVSPVILPFVIFVFIFIIAAFLAIIMHSRSLASSLGRLVSIAQSSSQLLPGTNNIDHTAPEFRSLEKALRAMAEELNLRFEQAKSESSRLEAILNGMSEAVFAMDQNLKLHLANPKAKELFNIGSRDVTLLSLLEATHSTELAENAKKAMSCGSPLETELTFHTDLKGVQAGGSQEPRQVRYFQVYASPLPGGVVLVLQEITRLVKLERVRKDFVANVSHELRTPIQLVKGFSETLLDAANDLSGGNKDQIIHFTEIIIKNAGIMENLTNDLLILADIENSNWADDSSSVFSGGRMEDQNIAFLVSEAVSSVQMQAKNKQIELIVNCPDDLYARLYGSLIIQALINLIDNGIKYSKAGSKIQVDVSADDKEIIFEVRDRGIGIPPEHLERIFERFYRVDRARSRAAKDETAGGTGLGLSIVRHIALIHKGRAEAESRTGEGSIFRVIVPSHNSYNNHNSHNTDHSSTDHNQESPAVLP